MAKKMIFDDANEEDVLECYLDRELEMSPLKIAAELGATVTAVQKICQRYNNQTKYERESWLKKYGWNWEFRKETKNVRPRISTI